MILWIFGASVIFLLVLAGLILEYSILIPPKRGLPVLMYHKVSEGNIDGITISAEKLRKQFDYIRRKGYQTLSFEDLSTAIKTGNPLPKRPLILTFDDAYRNFREFAVPLLKTYGFKASVFIPVGFMGGTNSWDNGSDPILSAAEIKELANEGNIEFGIHSFLHRSYAELDTAGMENDLELCIQTLGYHNIPFVRVLAYPYGSYPKKDPRLKASMKEVFRTSRLQFALRIGNRINPWPLKDLYEVKRIDIKGTDNFYTFKTKLRKGRRKVFS
jgi:peptidoglycan/xylan/chitin deacetylase (PgdA/CDA1 family)